MSRSGLARAGAIAALLAHDRALARPNLLHLSARWWRSSARGSGPVARFDDPRTATRSPYPLLGAMVLFTVGGLFLLLGG